MACIGYELLLPVESYLDRLNGLLAEEVSCCGKDDSAYQTDDNSYLFQLLENVQLAAFIGEYYQSAVLFGCAEKLE